MSYEFASRGCNSITTIEKNIKICDFIKKTAIGFKFEGIKVIKSDVFNFLKTCSESYDIIFADPPFKLENIDRIPAFVFEHTLLHETGVLIVEHPSEVDFSSIKQLKERREYGTVNFSIFGNT